MKRLLKKGLRSKAHPFLERPLVERLERRRLFAVAVTQTYPGFYEVDGDNSGNVINIAVSQASQTFTLNGAT